MFCHKEIDMQSFFCRVLAFVFLFNCLVPAPGAWAQQNITDTDMIRADIEHSVKTALANNLDANIEKAVEDMFAAKDIYAQKDAIIRLHQLMDKKYATSQQKKAMQQRQQKNLVQPTESTTLAKIPVSIPSAKNKVLQLVAKNEAYLTDLIEYIDPWNPADVDLLDITYASEVLGNTVDSFLANLDDMTKRQMNALLPMLQLRMMYRLSKLTPRALGSIQTIMAVGSMRIAMWKMHNYYIQTHQKDPLMIPQSNKIASDKVTFYRGRENQLKMAVQRVANSSMVLPPEIYQQINASFLNELSALKAKNPQEGDGEYQMLMTLADYAVAYALLVNPRQLVKIVKLFDKGPERSITTKEVQPGKFLQQYSALLNAIFISVFENTKYMTDSTVWPQVLEMLKDFSNPEKYSLPTRIFALEAASLLYRENTCQTDSAAAPKYPVFIRCNAPDPNAEKYRTLFASRVVDLYAPLTRTHYAAMEDYGLDSKQMKALADKLAYIYNGFANDELKWDSSRQGITPDALSTTDQNGKSLILNAKGSIPRLLPINQGNMFQLPNGKVWITSGFGRDSKGNWVEMQLHNKLNAKKVDLENGTNFMYFVGTAVFWIYGGEIFSWLGMAFRTTKGAIAALPKAAKAAAQANKGRRWDAAWIAINKNIRYANLPKNLLNNGAVLTAQHTVTKIHPGKEPETKIINQVVFNKRRLQRKKNWWNPQRWVGIKQPKVENYFLYQPRPGFKAVQGVMDVTNSPLSQGIRNWDDWRKLRAGFRSLTNPGEHVAPIKYDYNTLSTVLREGMLINTMNQAAKNGAFDVWLPIKTQSFRTMQPGKVLPSGTATAPAKAGESFMTEQEVVTWWNASRFGKPGNPLAWDKGADVYITPRTTKNLIDPEQLKNAVKIPFSKIASNEWQPELIKHFFKEVDRKGISRYLLPKYVPNSNFYSEVFHNWRFGLPAGQAFLSNTRFWKGWPLTGRTGLLGNLIFFTGLAAIDKGVYPFQEKWLVSASEKEHLQEQKKYGDAFDPAKLQQDDQDLATLMPQQGTDDHMSTLQDVRASQKGDTNGASISYPIIYARNELIPADFWGHLPLVTDQDKELYGQAAQQRQLLRAQIKGMKSAQQQQQQYQQDQAQMQADFQQMVIDAWREQNKRNLMASISEAKKYQLAAFSTPELSAYQPEVERFFQSFLQDMLAVYSTNENPQKQDEKAQAISQKYNDKWFRFSVEVSRMQELLHEQSVQEEEYDFDVPGATDLFPGAQQIPEDSTDWYSMPLPPEPPAESFTDTLQTDPAAIESVPDVPAEAY